MIPEDRKYLESSAYACRIVFANVTFKKTPEHCYF